MYHFRKQFNVELLLYDNKAREQAYNMALASKLKKLAGTSFISPAEKFQSNMLICKYYFITKN